MSSEEEEESLGFFRHPAQLTALYTVFYSLVFIAGLLGNTFVVLAVVLNRQLRTTTDYLISSLASADLLIILFCLPTTLLNNILTEWQLGAIMCKWSTWINSTTSCASIYTLVAVTSDRFFAICYTLKYTLWDSAYTLYVIACIWLLSGALAAPNLFYYNQVVYNFTTESNATISYKLCFSEVDEKLHFVVVNLILAFLVPFLLISISYTLIFIRVSTHRSLAVDAQMRDERIKLRVAHMMLTVIVVFALCWFPLYTIYVYFFFIADQTSTLFLIASTVLRPFFQWLSLLSSSLNPLIYIAYSQKYRQAFHRLLVSIIGQHYEKVEELSTKRSKHSTTRSSNGRLRRKKEEWEETREETSSPSTVPPHKTSL